MIGTSKVVAALGNLVRDLQVECVVLLPPGGVRGEVLRGVGRGAPLVVSCAALCRLLPLATNLADNPMEPRTIRNCMQITVQLHFKLP